MTKAIFFLLFLSALSVAAQDNNADNKKEIYQEVINKRVEKDMPLINETFTRVYKYEIDGNFDKRFYKERKKQTWDTSEIIGSAVCVILVTYKSTMPDYLITKGLEFKLYALFNQIDNWKSESLNKYLTYPEIIPFKKHPLQVSSWEMCLKRRNLLD